MSGKDWAVAVGAVVGGLCLLGASQTPATKKDGTPRPATERWSEAGGHGLDKAVNSVGEVGGGIARNAIGGSDALKVFGLGALGYGAYKAAQSAPGNYNPDPDPTPEDTADEEPAAEPEAAPEPEPAPAPTPTSQPVITPGPTSAWPRHQTPTADPFNKADNTGGILPGINTGGEWIDGCTPGSPACAPQNPRLNDQGGIDNTTNPFARPQTNPFTNPLTQAQFG